MRKPLSHGDDAIGHPIRRRMRAARRRMAQFLEPARVSALPAPFPNVERLTADAVPPAQIANRENARRIVPKQHDTLFHRTGLLERHRPISSNQATTLTCQESTRSKAVRTQPGLYRALASNHDPPCPPGRPNPRRQAALALLPGRLSGARCRSVYNFVAT